MQQPNISKAIYRERGVRQGDIISPKMFIPTMEEIFKKLNLQEKALNIDGGKLTHMRFADDVALIT